MDRASFDLVHCADTLEVTDDLEEACRREGITGDSVVSFEPASVWSPVRAVLDRRAGRISEDLPAAAGFHLSGDGHDSAVTYFAAGTKR